MQLTHKTDTGAKRLELVPFAAEGDFPGGIVVRVMMDDGYGMEAVGEAVTLDPVGVSRVLQVFRGMRESVTIDCGSGRVLGFSHHIEPSPYYEALVMSDGTSRWFRLEQDEAFMVMLATERVLDRIVYGEV